MAIAKWKQNVLFHSMVYEADVFCWKASDKAVIMSCKSIIKITVVFCAIVSCLRISVLIRQHARM